MKQILIILILFIGISNISCQNVEYLTHSIAEINRVDCEMVGFAATKSTSYKKFEKLKKRATKEELIDLLSHDSLSVVGYASYALIDRKLIQPVKLLEKFMDDDRQVSTMCGCLIDYEPISQLIYHRYWQTLISYTEESGYERFHLKDTPELLSIDSLILNSAHPNYLLLERAFENRIYPSQYDAKILNWAFEKGNLNALNYTLNNLRAGNEDQLIQSLNNYLLKKDIREYEITEVNKMLEEMNKKD